MSSSPPSSSSPLTLTLPAWQLEAKQAERAAIETVKQMFRTSESLNRIQHYMNESQTKKLLIEQQLSSAIRTQVDETRLGLELLAQSTTLINTMKLNFQSIDTYCKECKTVLKEYTEIQTVNIARRNLDSTTRLLDKFRSIPEQAEQLIDALYDDDRGIKDVYKTLRKLMRLRDTAFDQHLAFSSSFQSRLISSFNELQRAADEIEKRIWENIGDCELLAKDDPVVLIRTLEVIVMEDEAKRKVFGGTPLTLSGKNNKETIEAELRAWARTRVGVNAGTSMRDKCLRTLENTIAEQFGELHQEAGSGSKQSGTDEQDDIKSTGDYVCEILEQLTDLVENLPDLITVLKPCFPPDYGIDLFFSSRYRHWIKVTINLHINDLSKLSKKALLKTVTWIQWYVEQMKHMKLSTSQEDADFEKIINELMANYCKSTEDTLMALVNNIAKAEENTTAEPDNNGYYATTGPSDLFYTINQQMDIVLNSFDLRGNALGSVCVMIADVLTHYRNAQLKFLDHVEMEDDTLYFGENGVEKADTYFCAVINNCQQCQDNMDELKDRVMERLEVDIPSVPNPQYNSWNGVPGAAPPKVQTLVEKIEDIFDECGEGFVSVATEAVDILVLQIMTTLQKPISNLFTPSWLKEYSVTKDIVLTLQDFFDDYSKWISREAYFSRIVKNCLHSLVAEYLRKFTDVKPAVSKELFERLKSDKHMFSEFFNQYIEFVPQQLIKSELSLIKLVKEIVHADPDFISVHFPKITQRFGSSSYEVMEGLMAVRTDLTKSQRKDVLDQFAASAPKAQREEKKTIIPTERVKEQESSSSFWDLFRSKPKVQAQSLPSTRQAQANNNNNKSNSNSSTSNSAAKSASVPPPNTNTNTNKLSAPLKVAVNSTASSNKKPPKDEGEEEIYELNDLIGEIEEDDDSEYEDVTPVPTPKGRK